MDLQAATLCTLGERLKVRTAFQREEPLPWSPGNHPVPTSGTFCSFLFVKATPDPQ